MTARRPKREDRRIVPQPGIPLGGGGSKQAPDAGAAIRPFIASGGATYFVDFLGFEGGGFDPITRGTQLLAHVYVGKGQMGFIKQLRVGPYRPSILRDPWETSGIGNNSGSWYYLARTETTNPANSRLPQAYAAWREPMAWENYWNDFTDPRPSWRWSLRYYQGDIFTLRAQSSNVPPFSVLDPTSWYLVEDIAVPTDDAYPQGLPGDAPGPSFNAQRLQHLPEAPLETHLVVPPDTTILLFAQWEQTILDPMAAAFDTLSTGYNEMMFMDYAGPLTNIVQFPLMPSFGQIHGYVQAISSKSNAALDNVELGWG
jgi:hypothetical protein